MFKKQSKTEDSINFQVIDFKENCQSKFYLNEKFLDFLPEDALLTWKYNKHIKTPEKYDYAYIWAQGKNLNEICPEAIKSDLTSLTDRFKAFYVSFNEAKLDEKDVCFFDTLPKKFLKDWCEIKNQICKSVFQQEKPNNYNFQKHLSFLLEDIGSRDLNIDWDSTCKVSKKTPSLLRAKKNYKNRIIYNQFGTVTGRLATTPGSFPILTMDKPNRAIIKPVNDLFLELDYNAAELRTVLALTNKEQPDIDIHTWINSEIYKDKYSREDVKQKVFAWLYNSNAKNKKLNDFFERDKILNDFYNGEEIKTPFGRTIAVEKRKAVNYLIQSTTSDIVLNQAIKIQDFLKSTDSFISFILHDSIIVDISRTQKSLLPSLVDIFADTEIGKYKVNVSLGRDFGNMKRLKWQQ